MVSLDSRKVRILKAIINDYVETTKPVGSERLIEVCPLGCKSATVRNEMADLAEMGYLVQPHTSAGRIPTDRGYRYYVDQLMDLPALAPEEARRARVGYRQAQNQIEGIIQQTCRILSGLTSYTSVATDPTTTATTLRRLYLTEASPRHLLLVGLMSTGQVDHRLVEVEAAPADRMLLLLSNYVNSRIADQDLEEVAARLAQTPELPPELAAQGPLLARIFAAVTQLARAHTERRVYLEGAHQLLRQPEFQDVQRLETLLNALEQRSALYQVLSHALLGKNVTIIIGSENVYPPMQECSVVTTTYRIANRPAGYLGVVGPTRMRYDRAVAAVNLMAANLSQMLTNLSMA